MTTFNNDIKLKEELLIKLRHHQELDTFVQGKWLDKAFGKVEGNGFRGCFYGCTMQTSDNPLQRFSEKYSIERWFTDITEKIFEGLPEDQAKLFPLQCIEALPAGLDLNEIKSAWNTTVLTDQLRFVDKGSEQEAAIKKVIDLFKVRFNDISAEAAGSAARIAVWSSYSAAHSAAWSAVESAKLAAISAAEEAEPESARSAADSAERHGHYIWLRDEFIKLLKKQ